MRKGGEERIQSIGWDNLTTCLWGITTDQSKEEEDGDDRDEDGDDGDEGKEDGDEEDDGDEEEEE